MSELKEIWLLNNKTSASAIFQFSKDLKYCPETRYLRSQMIDQEHCVSGLQFKIKG